MNLDLPRIVADVKEFFVEDLNLCQVRIDRFSLEPDPRHGSWYVEVGTARDEVTVRMPDNTQRIFKECHISEVLEVVQRRVERERETPESRLADVRADLSHPAGGGRFA